MDYLVLYICRQCHQIQTFVRNQLWNICSFKQFSIKSNRSCWLHNYSREVLGVWSRAKEQVPQFSAIPQDLCVVSPCSSEETRVGFTPRDVPSIPQSTLPISHLTPIPSYPHRISVSSHLHFSCNPANCLNGAEHVYPTRYLHWGARPTPQAEW